MVWWEIYCFITGIAAGSSPDSLLGVWDRVDGEELDEIRELATGLVAKLVDTKNPKLPPREELETLLVEALTLLHTNIPSDPLGGYSILPESCQEICREVAVFGTVHGEEVPRLCICKDYDTVGGFDHVLCDDGEWVQKNVQVVKDDVTNTSYRKVHSKLEYGIICFSWGEQGQDTFKGDVNSVNDLLEYMCLNDVPHLNEAICQGLRGRGLAPAVLADFQGWVFERLDHWPCRPEGDLIGPRFTSFHEPLDGQKSGFLALPSELMLNILSTLYLEDILKVSSLCKRLRNQLTRTNTLSMLARDMVKGGALQWVQPCSLVEKEVDKANEALVTWLEDKNCANPLQSPNFPILQFLYACFLKSGSMKNRHRIWGIIKQLEVRWIAYQKGEDCDYSESDPGECEESESGSEDDASIKTEGSNDEGEE
ncbi:hypothetical protein DL96DRAFT_1618033 [Flagelloscypha sp. PMI_526]|nr:hypothetical protein DL96DRAFT_1618033 [Flagelloscypha sp. PMI_526]